MDEILGPFKKKVPHHHAWFVIVYALFAAIILFWATVQVANAEALNTPALVNNPETVKQAVEDSKPLLAKPGGSTETVECSCYTGVESKGANGRNPWSVATYRYPQGTKLFIEGFGEKVVETVTSKKYAHRIDLWFGETQEDYDRCIEFGTRTLQVTAY